MCILLVYIVWKGQYYVSQGNVSNYIKMNKFKTCWPEKKQDTFYECNPNSVSVEERIFSFLWYIHIKKTPCSTQTPKAITIRPQYAQSLYSR
jgi:hypothetical protein